ncbi:MAG: type II toxin-antitoxin system YafQ family toxin [Candidatus Shapirobacteria bacterium]
MQIVFHRNFKKSFKKRIQGNRKLELKFKQRLVLYLKDPNSPLLKVHRLKGVKREYWSFSVTGDIRVIFKMDGQILRLYDVGTHNQVY